MAADMQTLVTFAKTKGFVYPGSDIYGGLANSWDYGPLGSVLKENIKNLWIKNFVQKRADMVLLDAAILMNPQVWVASGHVGGFSDPLIDCKACNTRHRADKLIESKETNPMNPEELELNAFIKKIYIPKYSAEVDPSMGPVFEKNQEELRNKSLKELSEDIMLTIKCPDC